MLKAVLIIRLKSSDGRWWEIVLIIQNVNLEDILNGVCSDEGLINGMDII